MSHRYTTWRKTLQRAELDREPQGVLSPVRLGHASDRGPLLPEPLDDRVVHLQAPLGLHIEVDVRHPLCSGA
jgi:hypothetical protein